MIHISSTFLPWCPLMLLDLLADAVPRKILELMNVDGLTVKQVSSHLQVRSLRMVMFIGSTIK